MANGEIVNPCNTSTFRIIWIIWPLITQISIILFRGLLLTIYSDCRTIQMSLFLVYQRFGFEEQ